MDTPENFIKLNASAYKTIKKLQPESEIWLSAAYENYYKATAKALYNHYDKFNLHGARPDPRWFHDIDKQQGLKSKPWVCSEGHDLLVRGNKIMSEQEIALNMLKNLLFKIKHGTERIALFCMVNQAEMEMLPFFHRNERITQASGLFRKTPRLEPRLCTVVIGTFNHSINNGCIYSKEYIFSNGLNGVLLDTKQGGLLIVWNDGKKASSLPTELLRKISGKAVVKDWEENIVKPENYLLKPGQACFISGLEIKSIAGLPPSNKVLASDYDSSNKTENEKLIACGSTKPMTKTNPDWIKSGWAENPMGTKSTINTKSAKFRISATPKYLALEVEVNDSKQVYATNTRNPWNYDSIQFAIDTKSRGNIQDTIEFILAKQNGKAVLLKTIVPSIGGDLPVGWTGKMLPVKNAVYSIKSAGKGKILYSTEISWSELYPLRPVSTDALHFSILVNNNDGNGRDGWLEWGSGIGGPKKPERYGQIYFAEKTVSTVKLSDAGWKSWQNSKVTSTGTTAEWKDGVYHLKIISSPPQANPTWIQLYHDNLKLKNDKRYLLTFTTKSNSKGKLDITLLKPEPPWTRFCNRKIVIKKGLHQYSLFISSNKLDPEKTYSLRFFNGILPEGTYKISNISFVQLP